MDRHNLFEELEQDANVYQSKPLLKPAFLFGKTNSIRQNSNKHEFFRLLNSQQVLDNIR